MKNPGVFVLATLVTVWILQTIFLFAVPSALPTPHWMMLVTLALGVRGHRLLAMTCGLLWGLAADAYGGTAFGTQGFLLTFVGWATGAISKEWDAEKLVTQIGVAVVAALWMWIGVVFLRGFFAPSVTLAVPPWPWALAGLFLNACAAPAVFWAMDQWLVLWRDVPAREA